MGLPGSWRHGYSCTEEEAKASIPTKTKQRVVGGIGGEGYHGEGGSV